MVSNVDENLTMDWAQLILQLGISVVTLYILREALLRNDKRIDDRDADYHKFVNEHNDEMVNLMVESTNAIKKSSEAMERSSEFIQSAIETMREMRDRFIRSRS